MVFIFQCQERHLNLFDDSDYSGADDVKMDATAVDEKSPSDDGIVFFYKMGMVFLLCLHY